MGLTYVYLAGPIGEIDIKEAASWRETAEESLEEAGYIALNPLRGKDLNNPEVNVMYDSAWVVERDLEDIDKADILLVDGSRKVPMVGTPMEIRYAWERGKKIFTFGKAFKNSYWMRYHTTKFFDTLEEALLYLKD